MRSASCRSPSRTGIYTPAACAPQSMIQRAEVRDQRSKSEKGRRGAVRTSVTLLGQNIGNTMSIIGYTFSVSFAVLFGRISARIKFLVAKSTWPSRRRANQTSITSSAIGLSPTDQPPKLVLRKRVDLQD